MTNPSDVVETQARINELEKELKSLKDKRVTSPADLFQQVLRNADVLNQHYVMLDAVRQAGISNVVFYGTQIGNIELQLTTGVIKIGGKSYDKPSKFQGGMSWKYNVGDLVYVYLSVTDNKIVLNVEVEELY